MKGKKLIIGLVALIAAAAMAFVGWRLYENRQRETLYRAIEEAWQESESANVPAYLQVIDRETRFEVEKVEKVEKGDPYVITVTVYGIDLGGRLRETDPASFPDTRDEEVLNEYLLNLLNDAARTEVQTVIYAWPEGDGYRFRFSETFADAMTGMVYSYTRDLVNEMTGGAQ